ncbi:hypothetical protein H5P28_18780 [Ruficoccus amylovorans]|uniref:AsmA-like C-terminal domain-containing protein n=1 Tax=Ruficoccus amylovorans TaxID=1804625 RepID=A0A842HLH6_9BACT|nr:AsmA-like C-terminal region-containing protein [Ruficoccus amylovorans]MBC2596317.1 hypothetical protein [Ruficoccus amylovorans]
MSARSQHPVRPWWKHLLGWIHVLFNLGLLAALFAQGALIYLLWEDGELPIPGFVTDKVEQALAEQGYEVEIASMKLDLRGILLLRKIEVRLPGYHEPIAEADLVLIEFPPWAVFERHFLPDEVWLSRCNLFCPTVLSPTGAREQVAQDIFTEVAIRNKRLDLDRLILRLRGLDIRADGSLPVARIEKMMESDEAVTPEERDRRTAAAYAAFCREVLKANAWVERFTDPRVQVRFEPAPDGQDVRLAVDFQAEDFNLGQGIDGGRMTAQAEATGLDADSFRLRKAYARMRNMAWEGKAKAGAVQLQAIIPKPGLHALPQACELAAINVEAVNLKVDTVTGSADFARSPLVEASLHLLTGEDLHWLHVDGRVDMQKETADLAVRAWWDPMDLLKISFLEGKFEHPPDLDCSKRPRWSGNVRLDEGFRFASAEVELDFGRTRYEKLELTSAFARARVTPSQLDVYQAVLSTPRYTVEGSYSENFDTKGYRFLLEGNVDPMEISFLIDADWWEPLWKDFDFHGTLPYSNIDIQGFYGRGDEGKTFFGYNKLVDLTYQGVDVDTFTAMLWREPIRIILYDMQGKNREGAFNAALQFCYSPDDGDQRTSLGFAAASTLPLTQGAGLAGKEALGYVKDFQTTSPPQVQVNGLTVDGKDGREDQLYLKIIARMDTQTIYDGFVFDHLAFRGFLKPGLLQLRGMTFGMAGGKGTGQADVKLAEADGADEMALGVSLKGASYEQLQDAIPFLGEDEKDAPAPAPAPVQPPPPPVSKGKKEELAKIDFDLNAQGKTGDVTSFRGHGNIGVRDAVLGQIHLFGGFSRAIQAVGLNLGTVDFTKGQAPFVVGKGYAHFSKVEISGPTARIDANGNINLDTNELDFFLSLYPLGGIDVPVISQIFSAINPLTDVVEAQLQGTFSKPRWKVDFRPIGIFTGQKQVQNPTGQTPLTSDQSGLFNVLEEVPEEVPKLGGAGN